LNDHLQANQRGVPVFSLPGKPDLRVSDHEEGIGYPWGNMLQEDVRHLNFGCRPFIFKSKQYDSLMETAVSIDLISEVLVVRNRNPLFIKRFLDDIVIVHASNLIEQREHVVILSPQPSGHRRPSALIDKGSHRVGSGAKWIAEGVKSAVKSFPAVVLTVARQVAKSTLPVSLARVEDPMQARLKRRMILLRGLLFMKEGYVPLIATYSRFKSRNFGDGEGHWWISGWPSTH